MKLQQQQHFQRKYSTLFAWLSAAENVCSFSLHVCFFLYTILLPPLLQNQPFFINNSFFNLLFLSIGELAEILPKTGSHFIANNCPSWLLDMVIPGQKVGNILLLPIHHFLVCISIEMSFKYVRSLYNHILMLLTFFNFVDKLTALDPFQFVNYAIHTSWIWYIWPFFG